MRFILELNAWMETFEPFHENKMLIVKYLSLRCKRAQRKFHKLDQLYDIFVRVVKYQAN